MPKVKVSFYLTGESIPFENLTEQLEVSPSSSRRKQDWPQPSILAGIAVDTWEYHTQKEDVLSVSTQLDKIEKVFGDKVEIIQTLIEKYSLKSSITILVETEYSDFPEMVLTKENLFFLAAIKAELGFDFYVD